jgi:hypothetical protein
MENFATPVPTPKPDKPVTPEAKLLAFEKITTPAELLASMNENIHYGFVGKNNQRVYTPEDEDMDKDINDEYFLQSPEELINSGHGVCWDMTELERDWFTKHNYNLKVFFMMFAKNVENNLPTHTFLAFEDQGKWYWFEHAFGEQRGIHEYPSLNELIIDVKKKHLDYAIKNRGASVEDYQDLKICEYGVAPSGINPNEFIEGVMGNNPALDID